MNQATLFGLMVMALVSAMSGCVQMQPCPPNASCFANVVITTNVMATVPVSALPGAP